MKTKKDIEYSFNHTKQRILERYNFELSRHDYDSMCEKIKSKKDIVYIMMEKQKGDTQYTYDIQFKHRRDIRVVWSEKRQCITTVLKRRSFSE